MDTVYKVQDCTVKKLGERKYEFTASTSDIDRDGEVIEVTGWDLKNFKKNPIILYAHNYSSLPIGKATKVGVRDGKLINTVEFPPPGTYEFADIVERLVDTGYLNTESVGFVPKEWSDGDGTKEPRRTYTKQELLEISIVPVPSNPNALRNAVDDGVITTKQLGVLTDVNAVDVMERITQETDIIERVKGEVANLPRKTSQEEIKDEIDYLTTLIDAEGLNDESQKSLKELLKRLPADDIAVEDIVAKIEISDLPEIREALNQATQIIDDERIKLIMEQTIKNVVLKL